MVTAFTIKMTRLILLLGEELQAPLRVSVTKWKRRIALVMQHGQIYMPLM
jgi:hypothetical protein